MRIEAGLLTRLAAERFGASAALSFDGTTISFGQLNEAACRVGSGLLESGLRRGDRVGVLGYNCLELAQTWLGLEKHDLVRAVLHSHIGADAHVWSMNHVEATALIFDTRMTELVEEHRSRFATIRLFVAIGPDPPDWSMPFAQLLAEGSPEEPFVDVDEDAPCFLQLTSGTTGRPKPWVKTYRSWRAVVEHNMHHLDTFGPGAPSIGPEDVNLHFHPLQWASGFQTFYPYLLRGSRSVLLDDEHHDPEALLDAIAAEGVTGTFMPGPFLAHVLDAVGARGRYEHRLRRMVIVLATPDLLRRTTELLGPIWAHGFSSSEQGAVTTRLLATDLDGHLERIESVGRAGSPFLDVAVLDPVSGRRLGPGEIGETQCAARCRSASTGVSKQQLAPRSSRATGCGRAISVTSTTTASCTTRIVPATRSWSEIASSTRTSSKPSSCAIPRSPTAAWWGSAPTLRSRSWPPSS